MEIIQERLEREYNLDILMTAPSVEYLVTKTNGEQIFVHNPAELPAPNEYEKIEEPVMDISVFTPARYIGTIMDLLTTRRGIFRDMNYIEEDRVHLTYRMPLGELIVDFYDQLKSRTQAYASPDYTFARYDHSELVKLDTLAHGQPVAALSLLPHRANAPFQGRLMSERLK